MYPFSPSKATKTRIILVRHGQTELNAKDVVRGCLDVGLDATGHRQAENLCSELCREPPARIISGPLKRAWQTATHIAEGSGVEVEVDEALTDRDYGPWTGHARRDVIAAFGQVDNAPDIEPFTPFSRRVSEVLRQIADRSHPGDTVIVVAHKAVNRAALASLFPDIFPNANVISQRLGCWNRCEYDTLGWTLQEVDVLPGEEAEPVPGGENSDARQEATGEALSAGSVFKQI